MPNTFVQYEGDAATATYTVPFQYLEQPHVRVSVNGFPMTNGAHYDFSGPSSVVFRTTFIPQVNAIVDIRRRTPTAALVTYQNAAVLTAEDLNTAVLQTLYIVEEVQDNYEATINGGIAKLTNGFYTSGQDAIDAAVQEVLNSALLADLQTRITDIDDNGESIIQHNATLVNIQEQVDALGAIDLEGIGTLITNEQTARIAGDTALVNTIALIGAKSSDNTAFIANLNTLKVSPTESFAQRLAALSAATATASAAIVTEQTARANADSSLASSIATLQSTVGGQSASISTIQTVQNGIAAQFMVKTDVNGRVSGFGLYNTGATSEFIVLANKFAIVDPAAPGGTPKVPFVVTGGVVYMQNVVIGSAVIENLAVTTQKIANNAVTEIKATETALSTNIKSATAVVILNSSSLDFSLANGEVLNAVVSYTVYVDGLWAVPIQDDPATISWGPSARFALQVFRTDNSTVVSTSPTPTNVRTGMNGFTTGTPPGGSLAVSRRAITITDLVQFTNSTGATRTFRVRLAGYTEESLTNVQSLSVSQATIVVTRFKK
jgi:hypothetical protein